MEKFTTKQLIAAMVEMAKGAGTTGSWMLGYDELTKRMGDDWMDKFYETTLAPLMMAD